MRCSDVSLKVFRATFRLPVFAGQSDKSGQKALFTANSHMPPLLIQIYHLRVALFVFFTFENDTDVLLAQFWMPSYWNIGISILDSISFVCCNKASGCSFERMNKNKTN